MNPELERLPFDHYQRYAATASLIDALGANARVLEVGANRQRVLAEFLPRSQIVFSDLHPIEDAETMDDFVQADATALPFADGAFDAVACLDVLEHIPVDLRARATAEMARVCGRVVIIACPLDLPWVHDVEREANDVWRAYYGEGYPWLEEHAEFGLVLGDEIEQALRSSGMNVLRYSHGATSTWRSLMSSHFVKEAVNELRPLVAAADRLYNHSVFSGDRGGPSYREFFVATRSPSDLERLKSTQILTADRDPAATELLDLLGATLHAVGTRVVVAERGAADLNRQLSAAGELARQDQLDHERALADKDESLASLHAALAGAKDALDHAQAHIGALSSHIEAQRNDLASLQDGLKSQALALERAGEEREASRRALTGALAERDSARAEIVSMKEEAAERNWLLEFVEARLVRTRAAFEAVNRELELRARPKESMGLRRWVRHLIGKRA